MHPSDIPTGIIPTRRAPIADVAGQASAVAALEKVSAELISARDEGRMAQKIPLTAVDGNYLTRDRVALDPAEMEALKTSLRNRGQQTPIEVVQTTTGGYGLISGFRRLQALRELAQGEQGEQGVANVLAFVRQSGDVSQAYTAMVEENEIRVGLSYFERAHIVRRAVEGGVFKSEAEAIKQLFAAASRAKRSKIKSFLPVIDHLGRALLHPNALTERTGLALAARIAQDNQFAGRLRDRLRKAMPETAEDETQLLFKAITGKLPAAKPVPSLPSKGTKETAPSLVTVDFKPGELRLSGAGVTRELADKIRKLLTQ
jgi:ParB-like chromosome segregation protein Spo0J